MGGSGCVRKWSNPLTRISPSRYCLGVAMATDIPHQLAAAESVVNHAPLRLSPAAAARGGRGRGRGGDNECPPWGPDHSWTGLLPTGEYSVHVHVHVYLLDISRQLACMKLGRREKYQPIQYCWAGCLGYPVHKCHLPIDIQQIYCSAQTGQHSHLRRSCCPVWTLQHIYTCMY